MTILDSGEIPRLHPDIVDTFVLDASDVAEGTRSLTGYARNLPPTNLIRRHTDEHAAIEIAQTIGMVPDSAVRRRRSVRYVLPADRERIPGGRHRARSLAGPLAGFATFLAAAALILWAVTW